MNQEVLKNKYVLLIIFLIITFSTSHAQLLISSIFPDAGIPGTEVTLFGIGFDPITSNNQLFFSSVESSIILSDSNMIKAIVPVCQYGLTDLTIIVDSDTFVLNSGFLLLFEDSSDFIISSELIFNTWTDGPWFIDAGDFDGDGDMDVVSAAYQSDKIEWYENANGIGKSFNTHVIHSGARRVKSVRAANIDSDGCLDVIAAVGGLNKLAWYKNLFDGSTTYFGSINTLPGYINGPTGVFASDLDNDGDNDLIGAYYTANTICWYENTDGEGSFSNPNIITESATGTLMAIAADIDGDGDQDIVYNHSHSAWVENLDSGNGFGEPKEIPTTTIGVNMVCPGDIDLDGDIDILYGTWNSVGWCKNVDGLGTFIESQIMTINDGATSVCLADIDNDGDLDALYVSFTGDRLAYFLNDSGVFGSEIVIAQNLNQAKSIHTADLDSDGALDILLAYDHDFSYFRVNHTPRIIISDSIIIDEDESIETTFNVFDSFQDNLIVNILSDTNSIEIINNDSTLFISPFQNWFGFANILITASDGTLIDSVSVHVEVESINDPPDNFDLININDTTFIQLTSDNLNELLTFEWNNSIDVENDSILYSIYLTGTLEIFSFPNTMTTSISVLYDSLLSIISLNGLSTIEGTWTVVAFDGIDSTFASNGPLYLLIDASQVGVINEGYTPVKFALHQNYPNPFNPITTLSFDLPVRSEVVLTVYDILGRQVKTLVSNTQEAGYKSIIWDATQYSSGIYIYRIQAGGFSAVKKCILMK